jgi:hypothetical protein
VKGLADVLDLAFLLPGMLSKAQKEQMLINCTLPGILGNCMLAVVN